MTGNHFDHRPSDRASAQGDPAPSRPIPKSAFHQDFSRKAVPGRPPALSLFADRYGRRSVRSPAAPSPPGALPNLRLPRSSLRSRAQAALAGVAGPGTAQWMAGQPVFGDASPRLIGRPGGHSRRSPGLPSSSGICGIACGRHSPSVLGRFVSLTAVPGSVSSEEAVGLYGRASFGSCRLGVELLRRRGAGSCRLSASGRARRGR